MASGFFLKYVTFIYLLCFCLYFLRLVLEKESWGKPAAILTWIAFGGHLTGFVLRWIESYGRGVGHAPLGNRYESFIFFSLALVFLHLIVEWRTRNKSIGAFVTGLAFLSMAYASLSPEKNIEPLVPALQSNWLTVHVITCFLGYAAFSLAFGTSIFYLLTQKKSAPEKTGVWDQIPPPETLDRLTYQMIVIGFVFLTIGILSGSVWAQTAWGRYWSWDPKETWSLITWVIYAVLLHLRLIQSRQGFWMAVLSMIGFASVLFTYLGVNFLLSGLHSYG